MEELIVGDRIKDNDPRMTGRVLTIASIDARHVTAACRGQMFRILRRRIYTDGKQRRSGFSLMHFARPPQ